MAKYRNDPRWITARFDGHCSRCKDAIRSGERAFYYPADRALYCARESCGQTASRDFDAFAFDEEIGR